jgi:tRNA nucleotidyltransferase (CCA-adding enzyme)
MILKEKTAGACFVFLNNLGIFNSLGLNFNINQEVLELIDELRLPNISIKYEIVKFLALLDGLPNEDIQRILRFFNFEKRTLKKLEDIHKLKELNSLLSKELKRSAIYKQLIEVSDELLLYILSTTDKLSIKDKILDFFFLLKDIKPLISGKDLIELGFKPSFIFGKILEDVLSLQIDEILKTKEEAKDYILKNYGSFSDSRQ